MKVWVIENVLSLFNFLDDGITINEVSCSVLGGRKINIYWLFLDEMIF